MPPAADLSGYDEAVPHPGPQRSVLANGYPQPYLNQLTWNIVVGLAGLPATAAPAGSTPGGLAVGFQAVGARGSDLATIGAAGRLSALRGGVAPPPGLQP